MGADVLATCYEYKQGISNRNIEISNTFSTATVFIIHRKSQHKLLDIKLK